MSAESEVMDGRAAVCGRARRVSISKWVNEPLPPLSELLTTHDVVRLTRRRRWVIAGLVLLRRFPKKRTFHGQASGWLRSEVFESIELWRTAKQPRKYIACVSRASVSVQQCLALVRPRRPRPGCLSGRRSSKCKGRLTWE
jgi:hypothetical protein